MDRAIVGLNNLLGIINKFTESQAQKWYRQALTENGCWAKEEEEDNYCI